MLSYPEEVYVGKVILHCVYVVLNFQHDLFAGNASLEYRHSVNINFRSSESNYLPTTLLDDPHEVVASINKITMVTHTVHIFVSNPGNRIIYRTRYSTVCGRWDLLRERISTGVADYSIRPHRTTAKLLRREGPGQQSHS